MLTKVISHLPYLAAVTKHNSFSKAAKEISLTQSALSYQIQKLEDKIGFKVLIRGKGSKIELTSKGEQLVGEFNRFEKSFDLLLDDIHIHQKKRKFKISVPNDFGVKVITPILPKFENEKITLDLDLNDSVAQLKKSNFDFAIRNNTNETDLIYIELLRTENIVSCSKQYAHKHGLKTSSDINKNHRLIVRHKTKSLSWESLFRTNKSNFSAHQNKQLINNSFGILESTLSGFGISILPKYFISGLENDNEIIVLGVAEPTQFYIAFQDSPTANKWAQIIKKIIISNN